jgi:hypothetical protein
MIPHHRLRIILKYLDKIAIPRHNRYCIFLIYIEHFVNCGITLDRVDERCSCGDVYPLETTAEHAVGKFEKVLIVVTLMAAEREICEEVPDGDVVLMGGEVVDPQVHPKVEVVVHHLPDVGLHQSPQSLVLNGKERRKDPHLLAYPDPHSHTDIAKPSPFLLELDPQIDGIGRMEVVHQIEPFVVAIDLWSVDDDVAFGTLLQLLEQHSIDALAFANPLENSFSS